jgi:hypothetical protein
MALDREFDFDFDGELDSNDEVRYYTEVESKMMEDWDQYDSFGDYFSISSFEDADFNVDGF